MSDAVIEIPIWMLWCVAVLLFLPLAGRGHTIRKFIRVGMAMYDRGRADERKRVGARKEYGRSLRRANRNSKKRLFRG